MDKIKNIAQDIIDNIDSAPVGAVENVKGSFLISLSNILKELLKSREDGFNWCPSFTIDSGWDPNNIIITMTIGDNTYNYSFDKREIVHISDNDDEFVNHIASHFAHIVYKGKIKEIISTEIVKEFNNVRQIYKSRQ